MRRFADWAQEKEWIFVEEDHSEDVIYLEGGCPKYALMELVDQGYKIFICDAKLTNKLRKELEWEKSDENDAQLVQKIFHRNPNMFVEFTKPSQLELHMSITMRKYEQINKDLVSLKNRQKAMLREYGDIPVYDKIISLFEEEKLSLLEQVRPFIREELSLIDHIKGVGPTLTARLLAVAHPNRFPGKSSYVKYCGYTMKCWETKKYNRTAKSILYFMAKQVLMKHDPVYRGLYDKIKAVQLNKTCADCWLTKKGHKCKNRKELDQKTCKARAHTVTLNRVATKIAEEFWKTLHGVTMTCLGDVRIG